MGDYADEVRSPTGLERLARLLAATKEDAAAEISMLTSRVQALEIERRTLQAELESSRDQLGDANSLVEQLRLENTRKWRIEERDDWKALLESMQTDRTVLQQQTARLKTELTRCVATLLSIFPPTVPDGSGAGVGQQEAGEKRGSVLDVPATAENAHRLVLTHRIHGRRSRANVAIDLEWLDALAEEFNVECEVVDEDPGMNGNGGGSGSSLEEDSECAKLRLELDKLKHESEMKCVALESQVREQDKELELLRKAPARKSGASVNGIASADGPGPASVEEAEPRESSPPQEAAGVFRWWRRDDSRPASANRTNRRTAKPVIPSAAAKVTVV